MKTTEDKEKETVHALRVLLDQRSMIKVDRPTRMVVAGGRDTPLSFERQEMVRAVAAIFGVGEVMTGGCPTGVDHGVSKMNDGWTYREMRANWDKYGKAAGPIRNRDMAKWADIVVLFTGGRGTESMYQCALEQECVIFDFRDGDLSLQGGAGANFR
jgi:hypothetical protein